MKAVVLVAFFWTLILAYFADVDQQKTLCSFCLSQEQQASRQEYMRSFVHPRIITLLGSQRQLRVSRYFSRRRNEAETVLCHPDLVRDELTRGDSGRNSLTQQSVLRTWIHYDSHP